MIDTICALVDWKCNLKCSYCCNEIPRFRNQIKPIAFADIDWKKYPNVCISGGEPLLFPERVKRICVAALDAYKILYTNGVFLTEGMADDLSRWGIAAVNVGLHVEKSFDVLIKRICYNVRYQNFNTRFHVRNIYRPLVYKWEAQGINFRYWKMGDCDRPNEDRVIITDRNKLEGTECPLPLLTQV
jgi:uncharacterized Fe-S cluster-containing radical SAM superfamily protein